LVDFLLGFGFVAMILTPAVVATVQRSRSHGNNNKRPASWSFWRLPSVDSHLYRLRCRTGGSPGQAPQPSTRQSTKRL